MQFDLVLRADGIRIYACRGSCVIGGLDAEWHGNYLAIAAMYVVPAWRKLGVGSTLKKQFFAYLDVAPEKSSDIVIRRRRK